MGFWAGLISIGLAAAMIIFGKPRHGVERAFLRVWIVGVAYLMTAMILFVVGVATLISSWPWW